MIIFLDTSLNLSEHIKKFTLSPARNAQSDIEIASVLSDSDDPLSQPQKFTVNKMNLLPDRMYNRNSVMGKNMAYVIGM